jgi:hypothetical protein
LPESFAFSVVRLRIRQKADNVGFRFPILRRCYLDHSLSRLGGALESPIAASAGDKDEPSDAIPIVRS